ncbi:MAG: methylated-DNA--[protein]-cysteine S-methyltransferase [Proteobacteria bacterium]|nr:methylated-DNA--[protein]-cysteine S-methyltransferase [Pseudomonadota bacterium]
MSASYAAIIASPVGKLGLVIHQEQLSQIDFLTNDTALLQPRTPIAKEVSTQLKSYFQNPTHRFTLNLSPANTEFRKQVRKALSKIPSGKTLTYQQLAEQLKNHPRAIGQACRRNAIPIIIPCHRVLAKNGMGGFAGETEGRLMDIKSWLLNHESNS